jgi:hypothetical protein
MLAACALYRGLKTIILPTIFLLFGVSSYADIYQMTALAAYNAGPTSVERDGGMSTNQKTVSYVKRVLAYYSNKQVYSESRKPNTTAMRKHVVVVAVVDDDKALLANLASITAINNQAV